jgi:hypothetical protein
VCIPCISNNLVLAKVQAATCDLSHPNRSTELIVITTTLFAITSVLITLRLISRIWVSDTIGPDGWIIALALVRIRLVDMQMSLPDTDIASFYLSHRLPSRFLVRGPASLLGARLIVLVARKGFGKHVWDLADDRLLHILRSCKFPLLTTKDIFNS